MLYGKTYKEIYEYLSEEYTYINLSYEIEYYKDENEEDITYRINISHDLEINTRIPPNVIKDIVYDILLEFNQYISIFGYYDVTIDGEEICYFLKRIFKECLESIDKSTTEVSVYLDSQEPINPNEEDDYAEEIKNISAEIIESYRNKYV